MSVFEKVAETNEIPELGRKSILLDDLPALLLHVGDAYYAIEDVCTHDGQPLTEGPVSENCEITCPRHGARFDLKTGKPLCMPATEPVQTFAVDIRSDGIYVEIPE